VRDINKSLRFWRGNCDLTVVFDRPDEGIACLDLDDTQIVSDATLNGLASK
jgi:hypothetical protein